jgi:hypothetical protein
MIAVNTNEPLTPIIAARAIGLLIPAAILNNRIAGIAAAILACPEIIGGKLETNSVIFGTKNGDNIELAKTAIIASFLKISFPVPNTLGRNRPLVMVPMINHTFKLDIRTDLVKSLTHRRNFFNICANRSRHFTFYERLVIF